MGEVIRTLGLYQPFATLMLHGKVETRWVKKGKKPPFPLGKYLIYATKKSYMPDQLLTICGNQYQRVRAVVLRDDSAHITGHAICIGELYSITDPLQGKALEDDTYVTHYNDPEYRQVGLWFRNVQRIEPFPFKGKQGVGLLPANIAKQIRLCDGIGCQCKPEEKHGETSIMCCNHCGKPTESFWTSNTTSNE